jgi:methionyl-tRNA formyltransferase
LAEACVFFGTPEFAVPALKALLASRYEVKAAVTRPDRPAGRGRRISGSPVKRAALEAGLPVLQPPKLRDPETMAALMKLAPDFIVVAAYGLIVPPEVLAIPPCGVLNIHPSLLPRHRGASPIAGAILAGDDVTGVSIMLMDEGLDTGPVLSRRELPIGPNESTGELTARLAVVSADLLVETIPSWLSGRLQPEAQDEAKATYAPQLKREDGHIDWDRDAGAIWRQVRAMNPWPGAQTSLHGARLTLWRAWPLTDSTVGRAGEVLSLAKVDTPEGAVDAIITCAGSGSVAVLELQKEGRKALAAGEFARGERELTGSLLGTQRLPG